MRILVTGGAGFLGSTLVERHLGRGDRVVVLDDLSTGSRANLANAMAGSGDLRVVEGSVCDPAVVDSCVDGCDLVYHMAAAVGVQLLRERPLHALRTNGIGVDNVLAACAGHGAAVVIASSSEVYGDAPDAPFGECHTLRIEDSRTLRSGYASAKAQAECAAFTYANELGLRAIVVRLFNTVGSRQRARYGMVIPRFVEQALQGRPLTVFGDGQQTRCFAHVDDVVAAIMGLVDARCFGEVFNVGSDRETTIAALASIVLEVVGEDVGIEHVPFDLAHPGIGHDVRRRVPDLTRLRGVLGAEFATRELRSIVQDVVRARAGAARL